MREKKTTWKKRLVYLMMLICLFACVEPMLAQAAKKKKVKLNYKKVTCTVGKKKKIKLLNNKKKVKWSVSSKKILKITKKTKSTVTVQAKKKGTAYVIARVGKKKYKCKVIVKKKKTTTKTETTTEDTTETTTEATTEKTTENKTEETTTQVKPTWKVKVEEQTKQIEEKSNVEWSLGEDGTLTVTCNGDFDTLNPEWKEKESEITSVVLKGNGITSLRGLFENCTALISVDFTELDTSKVTDMSHLFYGCKELQTITFGEKFNTGKVKDFSGMFQNCPCIETLDVSRFNTENATNMSRMFKGCKMVTSLDLSSFNTSKVTDMSYMFSECSATTMIGLSGFDTSSVTDMSYMFSYYTGRVSWDFSNWDTSKVQDMSYMFKTCSVKTLNMKGWNTSNVTDMAYMFDNAMFLSEFDVSSFDTSNVTDMSHMFAYMENMLSFELDNFSMAKVKDATGMFYNDWATTRISMANAQPSQTNSFVKMFYSCMYLEELVIPKFSPAEGADTTDMFGLCAEAVIPDWYQPSNDTSVPETSVEILRSGEVSDGITWQLDSENVLTISGTGVLGDDETGVNWKYVPLPEATAIVIEEGITEIAADFFKGCQKVKAVTIPATVTRLGTASLAMPDLVKASILSDTILYDGDVFGDIEGQLVIWCNQQRQITEGEEEETTTTSQLYAVEHDIPYIYTDASDKSWTLKEGSYHNYTGEAVLGELPASLEKINGEWVVAAEMIDHVYYSDKEINRDNYYLCSETMPSRTLPGKSKIYYYAIISGYKSIKGQLTINVKATLESKTVSLPYGSSMDAALPVVSDGCTTYYSEKYLDFNNYKKLGSTTMPTLTIPGNYRIYCLVVPNTDVYEKGLASGHVDVTVEKKIPNIYLDKVPNEVIQDGELLIETDAEQALEYIPQKEGVVAVKNGKLVAVGTGEVLVDIVMKETAKQQEKKVTVKITISE